MLTCKIFVASHASKIWAPGTCPPLSKHCMLPLRTEGSEGFFSLCSQGLGNLLTVSMSWDLEVLCHWGKLTLCLSFALQKRCTQRLSEFLALAACLHMRTGKKCHLPMRWSTRCRDLSPSCPMFRGAPLLTPTLKATSSPRYLLLSRPRERGAAHQWPTGQNVTRSGGAWSTGLLVGKSQFPNRPSPLCSRWCQCDFSVTRTTSHFP